MKEDRTITILKSAILLERQGKTFYTTVAKQTTNKDVKEIFEAMAKEEELHADFLSKQFKSFNEQKKFINLNLKDSPKFSVRQILTTQIKNQISSASYEAAAISAAMLMEEKAIKTYSDRAKETADPNEKSLYEWLAKWEHEHLAFLAELNNELAEKVWYDNQFWPF